MANETSKAMRRRWCEHYSGVFPWKDIFVGRMIDVGCGPDKLPFDNCIGFDEKDGDANQLSTYFDPESFDLLHGSQVLEHMDNPALALRDWLKLVKPGGHVVQSVPDWFAYEGGQWPSRYNPDHKSSFSMLYRGSCAPIHVHIPTFLEEFRDVAEVRLARFVDSNYDWNIGTTKDQTWIETDMVECWNEFVLKKK